MLSQAWAKIGALFILLALGLGVAYLLYGWGLSPSPQPGAYRLVTYWTEAAGKPFDQPYGIAVDPRNGDVLVTDGKNQRVVVFSASGRFVRQWGRKGEGAGQFDLPAGIVVGAEGSIYVSDYNLDRIQRFSESGRLLSTFGGDKGPKFDSPIGLDLDEQGRLYAADFWTKVVHVLDRDGHPAATIGKPGQFGPGRLDYPSDVDVGADGSVLVADTYNYRVQLFDSKGRQQAAWGWHLFWFFPRPSGGNWGFSEVTGVALSPKGELIHVADSVNQRVVMLDSQGRFITDWKVPDVRPGLGTPMQVATSLDGKRLYATDVIGNRIIVLAVE